MSDFNNILNQGAKPSDESLKRYLEGTASEEERFMIEHQMTDEAFMNDAVEGLQQFKDPQVMQDLVNKINKDLLKHTVKKKRNKLKHRIEDQKWTMLSIIIIIILCILGYFVIHLTQNPMTTNHTIEQKK
ncbi:MAG: hypothetical protein WCR66_02675 [Bacteroidota bacterium]